MASIAPNGQKRSLKTSLTSRRPSTAPSSDECAPPFGQNGAPLLPQQPSKTRWFKKRLTSLRSASPLPADKDAHFTMISTATKPSHTADPDDVGRRPRMHRNSSTPPISYAFDDMDALKHTRNSQSQGGDEPLFDFLQALDATVEHSPKPRPRSAVIKQAPPLIDLTGGIYFKRNINTDTSTTRVPPPLDISPSAETSITSATGSTFTATSTLIDSPPPKSTVSTRLARKTEGSASSPPASIRTFPERERGRANSLTEPSTINNPHDDDGHDADHHHQLPGPLVLPITAPKSKLTTATRAGTTPPLQSIRYTSSTTSLPNAVHSITRSASAPADLPSAEDRVLTSLKAALEESLALLRPLEKVVLPSVGDWNGCSLTWTRSPVIDRLEGVRAPPPTPEMAGCETGRFEGGRAPGISAERPPQAGVEDGSGLSGDVEGKIPDVVPSTPAPVLLPRTPERARLRVPRRQPQAPFSLRAERERERLPRSASSEKGTISFPSSDDGPEVQPTLPSGETPLTSSPTDLLPTTYPPLPPEINPTERELPPSPPLTPPPALPQLSPHAAADHVSQQTLLKPVVRKASDVSLKRLFEELDGERKVVGKKMSFGGLGKAGVGAGAGGVGKKKRPTTAGARVDLTRVKVDLLRGQTSTSTPTPTTPTPTSTASKAPLRTPISTRRPRTATEPRHSQLIASSSSRPLNMDWDRSADPWADEQFHGIFGREGERERAMSEAGMKKGGVGAGLGKPRGLLKKKSSALFSAVERAAAPQTTVTMKREEDVAEAFDSERMLTMREVFEASLLDVWDKDGNKVQFGKVFEDQVTIVIFIRHFWCPMCQDYMKSIARELRPGRLAQARVKLVVIGCGDPAMIRSYNEKIVKSPFEMYTDPKLQLFAALGMTLKTTDGGPEADKGSYIKHGTLRGTLNVIGRALVNMAPGVMVKRGGDIKQLGGEFILGPGLRCRYTHRMSTTRNHAPIREIALKAGVPMDDDHTPLQQHIRTPSEDEAWNARRKGLTRKKVVRRMSELDALPKRQEDLADGCGGVDGEVCPMRGNVLVGTV